MKPYTIYNTRSLVLCCISLCMLAAIVISFREEQLRYPRVRKAFSEKEAEAMGKLRAHGVDVEDFQLMLLSFKAEKELQLWAKSRKDMQHRLIETYAYCNSSGTAGPKRARGDYQIPEGLYYIDRFNPNSSFHLSLGINYPNKSDKILSKALNKGGDIFIHGDCVTVGCIPITDDKIKELYLFAVMAKDQGQSKIPVAIFPAKLEKRTYEALLSSHAGQNSLLAFWKNLKVCYDRIMAEKGIPKYSIDSKGNYVMP